MKKKLTLILTATLTISTLLLPVTSFCTTHSIAKTAGQPKLSAKKLIMKTGQTKKLKLKNVSGKNQKKIKWSSNNKSIITVNKSGFIKAKKKGKGKIMAKYNNKTYTCNVTVKKRPATKPDPYDGDVAYPVSFAYTEKNSDVTYGKVKIDTYFSTTTNKNRKCAVVLPPNYDKNKKYPVCYLLHGLGQDHTDWLNANAPVIIGNMIAEKTAKEMILVLPNCRARANDTYVGDAFSLDNYRAFDNFINDLRDNLMPYIKENYSVAEGRENTAIAGFSMGGRTALYIGLSMQDTFGYIGGFCPAPGLFAYEMNGIAEDGLFKADTFKLNDEYADNTLLMIVAAKSDTVVFDIPETYHNALVNNNTKHIWYKTTSGHDATVMDHGFYNFAKRLFNN